MRRTCRVAATRIAAQDDLPNSQHIGNRAERTANHIDLARAAGVSISIVPRALSNSSGISAQLRARNHQLAQELGYHARGAGATGPRMICACVTANLVTGGLVPFYNTVMEGLTNAANAADPTFEVRLIQDESLDPSRMDRDGEAGLAACTMLVGIDTTPTPPRDSRRTAAWCR